MTDKNHYLEKIVKMPIKLKPVRGEIQTTNPMRDLGSSMVEVAKQTQLDIKPIINTINAQAIAKDDLNLKLENTRINNKIKLKEAELDKEILTFEDDIFGKDKAWSEEDFENFYDQREKKLRTKYLDNDFKKDTKMAYDTFYPSFLDKMNNLYKTGKTARWNNIIFTSNATWNNVEKESIRTQINGILPNDEFFKNMEKVLEYSDIRGSYYSDIDSKITKDYPEFRSKLEEDGWYRYLSENYPDKIQLFNVLISGEETDYIEKMKLGLPIEVQGEIKPSGKTVFTKYNTKMPTDIKDRLIKRILSELDNELKIDKFKNHKIITSATKNFNNKKKEFNNDPAKILKYLNDPANRHFYETSDGSGTDLYNAHITEGNSLLKEGGIGERRFRNDRTIRILLSSENSYVTSVSSKFWVGDEENTFKNLLVEKYGESYKNGLSLAERYGIESKFTDYQKKDSFDQQIVDSFKISDKQWEDYKSLISNIKDETFTEVQKYVKTHKEIMSAGLTEIDLNSDRNMYNITKTITEQAKQTMRNNPRLTWENITDPNFDDGKYYIYKDLEEGKFDQTIQQIIDARLGVIDETGDTAIATLNQTYEEYINQNPKSDMDGFLESDAYLNLMYKDPKLPLGNLYGQRDHKNNITPLGVIIRTQLK